MTLPSGFPQPSGSRAGWPWIGGDELCSPSPADDIPWPKVSIVTPSFNQGQYLEETIRSVLLQGYPNLEYLVIDGGSSDNSVDIIRKYEPWLAYWVSEPDAGQADAINKGMRKSTGEYLGWLNSDDLLYPSAIRWLVEAFQHDKDADLIYGDVEQGQSFQHGAKVLHGEQLVFSSLLRTLRVPIPQQGSLWRRSVIERIGPLDPRWQVVLDREFFTRASEKCCVRYRPGVLGFFRNHDQSKSISQKRRWLTELPQMYAEFFERSDLSGELTSLKGETMGIMYLTCASLALQCGESRRAASYFASALTADPIVLFRRHVRSKLAKFFRST